MSEDSFGKTDRKRARERLKYLGRTGHAGAGPALAEFDGAGSLQSQQDLVKRWRLNEKQADLLAVAQDQVKIGEKASGCFGKMNKYEIARLNGILPGAGGDGQAYERLCTAVVAGLTPTPNPNEALEKEGVHLYEYSHVNHTEVNGEKSRMFTGEASSRVTPHLFAQLVGTIREAGITTITNPEFHDSQPASSNAVVAAKSAPTQEIGGDAGGGASESVRKPPLTLARSCLTQANKELKVYHQLIAQGWYTDLQDGDAAQKKCSADIKAAGDALLRRKDALAQVVAEGKGAINAEALEELRGALEKCTEEANQALRHWRPIKKHARASIALEASRGNGADSTEG